MSSIDDDADDDDDDNEIHVSNDNGCDKYIFINDHDDDNEDHDDDNEDHDDEL